MNLDELGQLARHNFWTTFKPADCERADAHSYEEGAKFGYALAQDEMTKALAEWKEREKLWTEMMDRQDAATRKAEAELAELITTGKKCS